MAVLVGETEARVAVTIRSVVSGTSDGASHVQVPLVKSPILAGDNDAPITLDV